MINATGAEYRKLALPDMARFEGAGIYYGATFMEAQLCSGEEVIVVGGGNSAGQAAVFLAQTTEHVHVLIRSEGRKDTMSRYLISRIEGSKSITLHTHTELTESAATTISRMCSGRIARQARSTRRPFATCS